MLIIRWEIIQGYEQPEFANTSNNVLFTSTFHVLVP